MKGEFEKKLERFQKDAKTVLGIKLQFLPEEVYSTWIDEARKAFPIEFWRDVVTEEVEDGNSTIERQRMPNASLPKNRANVIIDKDKVIDWFLKWFGQG